MNVSYEWLQALVPFDQSPAELRELITAHVATVDELVALRQELAPIVVARVVEEAPHPDSDHLHVTRVDAGTLQYTLTINDPVMWTRPWTLLFPLKQDPGYGMFEYACHEGNYGLRNILSGSRADERRAR